MNALRAVPGITWLPLAMIWFGTGMKTTVFLVAKAAFFPVFLNAAAEARQVDRPTTSGRHTVLFQKRQEIGMRPHLRAVALPSGKTEEKILEIERLHKVFHITGGFQTVLEEITFRAEGGELS